MWVNGDSCLSHSACSGTGEQRWFLCEMVSGSLYLPGLWWKSPQSDPWFNSLFLFSVTSSRNGRNLCVLGIMKEKSEGIKKMFIASSEIIQGITQVK